MVPCLIGSSAVLSPAFSVAVSPLIFASPYSEPTERRTPSRTTTPSAARDGSGSPFAAMPQEQDSVPDVTRGCRSVHDKLTIGFDLPAISARQIAPQNRLASATESAAPRRREARSMGHAEADGGDGPRKETGSATLSVPRPIPDRGRDRRARPRPQGLA